MSGLEPPFITIAEASRRIARRELSPVELTEAYLQRIAAVDDQLMSFVTLTAELARQRARAAEAEIMRNGPRSPIHGIAYCLKDIIETAGIRTTAQSKLLADHIPAKDAVVAQKLAAAGGILLGKTATWEFAHGGPSWDTLFPPAHNPWNTDHHPAARPRVPGRRWPRVSRRRRSAATPAGRSAVRRRPAASPGSSQPMVWSAGAAS